MCFQAVDFEKLEASRTLAQPNNISNENYQCLCEDKEECIVNMGTKDNKENSCQADQKDISYQGDQDDNSCQEDQYDNSCKGGQANQEESYFQAEITESGVAEDKIGDDISCQPEKDDNSCLEDQDEKSCITNQDGNSCKTDLVENSSQADPDEKSSQAYQDKKYCQAEITDLGIAEDQVNVLTTKADNSTQLNETGSIGPAIEWPTTEEKKIQAKEIVQSKETERKGYSHSEEKDVPIPGSWKKGDVPSSTLTSLHFTKMNQIKISSQKFPCFIPKSGKWVKLQGYI